MENIDEMKTNQQHRVDTGAKMVEINNTKEEERERRGRQIGKTEKEEGGRRVRSLWLFLILLFPSAATFMSLHLIHNEFALAWRVFWVHSLALHKTQDGTDECIPGRLFTSNMKGGDQGLPEVQTREQVQRLTKPAIVPATLGLPVNDSLVRLSLTKFSLV